MSKGGDSSGGGGGGGAFSSLFGGGDKKKDKWEVKPTGTFSRFQSPEATLKYLGGLGIEDANQAINNMGGQARKDLLDADKKARKESGQWTLMDTTRQALRAIAPPAMGMMVGTVAGQVVPGAATMLGATPGVAASTGSTVSRLASLGLSGKVRAGMEKDELTRLAMRSVGMSDGDIQGWFNSLRDKHLNVKELSDKDERPYLQNYLKGIKGLSFPEDIGEIEDAADAVQKARKIIEEEEPGAQEGLGEGDSEEKPRGQAVKRSKALSTPLVWKPTLLGW